MSVGHQSQSQQAGLISQTQKNPSQYKSDENSSIQDAAANNREIKSVDHAENDRFISEFKSLTRDMVEFLEKNKLSNFELALNGDESAKNEAKRKEENIRRKEIKDKINSLLSQYDKSNDRIPLWRHRMRGNMT
jgi:hypothetical protein